VILDRETTLGLLRRVVDLLVDRGVAVQIHLVGGAAIMLTVDPGRSATADVDSWINTVPDSAARIAVDEVVLEVARSTPGLPDDWLNDNARLFIPESVSGADDYWDTLIEEGGVGVSAAKPEILLAMKLRAGRGRRDLPDLPSLIEACRFSTRAEIDRSFERLFPHDEINPRAARWLDINIAAG